ncbi:MAG: SGNH/GDSL hydrolase family protein [Actinomycetota bacterium]
MAVPYVPTRRWLFLVAATVAVVGLLPTTSAGATSSLPHVIASTGDSITRAFDVGWCCILRDAPEYSWSTGTSVDSHYVRLTRFDPKIVGNAYNDARSGAKMSELATQLSQAAGQRADYVTVLMGANDVCTSTVSTMTATATFEAQFRAALSQFTQARPRARIFVSSIPNVYRLWEVLHTNFAATLAWSTFGICQSMLSSSNTDTERAQVLAQEGADNDTLARICAQFTQCRWDGYATYNTTFYASDISPVDYFHPSSQGQNKLASVTWAASYWPTS